MKKTLISLREKVTTPVVRKTLLVAGIASGALMLPDIASAATAAADTEFARLYTFVSDAATGNLGRALAITGGLFGLAIGATTGRAMVAALGVVLAIFGSLGPTIINAIFGGGAII